MGTLAGVAADARDYFSAEELARASRYRRGQRRLSLAAGAAGLGVLAAARGRSPLAVQLLSGAAEVPFATLARRRAMDVGLDTQSWRGWARDQLVVQAIATPLMVAGGAAVAAAQRRWGARWWVPGAAGLSGVAVLGLIAGPTLIQPVFNDFEPVDDELGDRVRGIAARAGVPVDRVLVMDASRRTTGANAYVTGLGPTKRVVFYDNLLRDYTPAEVDFVVAHELAHVRHRDVQHGLMLVAAGSPALMWAVAEVARRLGDSFADVNIAFAAVWTPLLPLGAALSRRIERRADRFALELIDDPRALVDFFRRICVKNVAEPQPPRLVRLLASHPAPLERIACAS